MGISATNLSVKSSYVVRQAPVCIRLLLMMTGLKYRSNEGLANGKHLHGEKSRLN